MQRTRSLTLLVGLVCAASLHAQDYRSKATGNWNALSTWEQNDGLGWVDATVIPSAASGAINIRSPHTVTVTTGTYQLEEVTIEAGATLTNASGTIGWQVNNGSFGVRVFGTLNANGGGSTFGCCATVSVENGGVVNQNAAGSFFNPTTVQVGGTVNGNTQINIGSGTIVNNGTWTMTGSNVINNTGAMNFTNNGILTLRGASLAGTLTNNSTVNWSAGVISGSGNIQNTNGAEFNISVSGINQLNLITNNAGTINYNGTGNFNPDAARAFTSSGTLNVNSGIWDNYGNQAHNGTVNIQPGATLRSQVAVSVGGQVNNTGTFTGVATSFTGSALANNGSVTLANLTFSGTAAQALNGTGTISTLTLNNANGVTLGGTQTVTGTLTFTNGRITLGDHDLVLSNSAVGSLVGGTAVHRFVTNGTGAFHRQVNGANYLFPIGTATSYLPVALSLTAGPAERFGARVRNDVHADYAAPGIPAGALVTGNQVERTWIITEEAEGGNQATVQLQWNTADEGSGFGRANCALHSYNGTDWVALAFGAAGGSDPWTRSASDVSVFREFTVADGDSPLPIICNNGLLPGDPCDDGNPLTENDTVDANCDCVGVLIEEDCEGVAGGSAQPGTACDDGDPFTINDTWTANCQCIGTPVNCTEIITLEITLDAFGSETTWEVYDETGTILIANGGPYANGTQGAVITESICLNQACYRLVVNDDGANGIQNGGYILSDANGRRIINANGLFASTSTAVQPFCLPVSGQGLIAGSCDRTNLVYASSTQIYASTQPGASGYQFWIFDPHGSYNRRVFSTTTNIKPTTLATNPVPADLDLNVRVRALIGGNYTPFGRACIIRLNTPGGSSSRGVVVMEVSGMDLSLFPNPSRAEVVNLAVNGLAEMTAVQLEVIDLFGKRVHAEQFTVTGEGHIHTLDVKHLATGMYIVNLRAGEVILTQRMVRH